MATQSVQRTMRELKKRGYTAHVVERWNQWAHKRQDFGGFADILAYKPGESGVLAVQACSDNGGDVSAHIKKLVAIANVRPWILSNNRLEIWGWGLRGARGERKLWTLRIIHIDIEHLVEPVLSDPALANRPS